MFRNVYLKSLRDQRRSLLGWSIGVVGLVVLMSAIWPTFRDMPDLQQFLDNYPKQFGKLFNVDAMLSGSGYLNAELFSIMLPALFVIFGIARGARMIAGEEETGTLEAVLVTPVSPVRLLLQQAAALATAVGVLGVMLFLAILASSGMFDLGVAISQAAVAALSMVLLGVEHGYLALAVGAVAGRRSLAIAVAGVVALLGYVLYIIGQLVERFRDWQPVSPFHQAIHAGPIGGGLTLSFVWMALATLAFVTLATPVFNRRDIRGH